MKPLYLIIFLCFILGKITAQNATINVVKPDSLSTTNIIIVHFDKSLGAIFPASYAQVTFGENVNWKHKSFFTVDSNLIKQIDTAFVRQYCIANRKFIDKNWDDEKSYLIENETNKEYLEAKKSHKNQIKLFEKYCPAWQEKLSLRYKQYIGFINKKGEKVVYIHTIDFDDDQFNLKSSFANAWIEGFGDWFEKNTQSFYYNIDKNLLTVNEDK